MQSITRSANYLCRNSYSFCFRMKVPKDLQPTITKKELRYSLKTGNLSLAKTKARFVAGQGQLFFRDIRKGCFFGVNITKGQIQSMIKTFMQKTIKSYDQPVLSIHIHKPTENSPAQQKSSRDIPVKLKTF